MNSTVIDLIAAVSKGGEAIVLSAWCMAWGVALLVGSNRKQNITTKEKGWGKLPLFMYYALWKIS